MTEALSTLEELIESYLAPDLTAPKRRDIQDELAKRLHGAGILGSFDRDLFTRFGGEVLLRRAEVRGGMHPSPGCTYRCQISLDSCAAWSSRSATDVSSWIRGRQHAVTTLCASSRHRTM